MNSKVLQLQIRSPRTEELHRRRARHADIPRRRRMALAPQSSKYPEPVLTLRIVAQQGRQEGRRRNEPETVDQTLTEGAYQTVTESFKGAIGK